MKLSLPIRLPRMQLEGMRRDLRHLACEAAGVVSLRVTQPLCRAVKETTEALGSLLLRLEPVMVENHLLPSAWIASNPFTAVSVAAGGGAFAAALAVPRSRL